jgi:DNA-binding XRE family transcriptional regulator
MTDMNIEKILDQDPENIDDPRNLPVWKQMDEDERHFALRRAGLIVKQGANGPKKRPVTDIPAQLLMARTKAGLTQAQLAELACLTQSAYARIEAGRANPTLKTLIKLADVLGQEVRMQSKG